MPTVLEAIERDEWWWEASDTKVVPLGRPATIDDLRRTRFKAEIVGGQMIVMGPSGPDAGDAHGNILFSLIEYKRRHGGGLALGPTAAFIVDLPHRQSFCPDVSWYTGAERNDFPREAPVLAVEVRDWPDYGDEAEQAMAAKRADYFAAGTRVVWDVDVLRDISIRSYRADDPEHPIVYRTGETANAEPAVPGWRFPVDELFD